MLLVFLDGVGLGEADPVHNPWVAGRTPALRGLLGGPLAGRERVERDGVLLVPTDATLGVAGLPQSATGQTALLTGLNAAALVGRHVTAYPTAHLRALLLEHSLFVRLTAAGRRVALANAYTEEYHEAVAAGRLRHGAITTAAVGAGVRLRTVADLRRAQAVFHDLTNAMLRAWGYDLPLRTPFQAGQHLAHLAAAHDFTLFEFFLTDLAAHGRVEASPTAVVELVDQMLAGVTAGLPAEASLVVTSDHGNLEDGRTRAHTANPVPTLVLGPARRHFRGVAALTDVAPAVLRSLGVEA